MTLSLEKLAKVREKIIAQNHADDISAIDATLAEMLPLLQAEVCGECDHPLSMHNTQGCTKVYGRNIPASEDGPERDVEVKCSCSERFGKDEIQAAVGAVTEACCKTVGTFGAEVGPAVAHDTGARDAVRAINEMVQHIQQEIRALHPGALKALEEHDAAHHAKLFFPRIHNACICKFCPNNQPHWHTFAELNEALARRLAQETVKAFEAAHSLVHVPSVFSQNPPSAHTLAIRNRAAIATHPDYLAAKAALEKDAG